MTRAMESAVTTIAKAAIAVEARVRWIVVVARAGWIKGDGRGGVGCGGFLGCGERR